MCGLRVILVKPIIVEGGYLNEDNIFTISSHSAGDEQNVFNNACFFRLGIIKTVLKLRM